MEVERRAHGHRHISVLWQGSTAQALPDERTRESPRHPRLKSSQTTNHQSSQPDGRGSKSRALLPYPGVLCVCEAVAGQLRPVRPPPGIWYPTESHLGDEGWTLLT